MKGKIAFLAGGAAGYVLGARAGRQRYEQIKRRATSTWRSPAVQDRVEQVSETAKETAATAAQAAAQKARDTVASRDGTSA